MRERARLGRPSGAEPGPKRGSDDLMGAFLDYLLDLILALIALRMLYAALRHLLAPHRARGARSPGGSPAGNANGQMVRDPECGMFVSTEVSHRLKKGGETLHFCSQDCLEKYRRRAA
jgi:YHS domain-containing protein